MTDTPNKRPPLRRARLVVEVQYDEAITTADAIASSLDLVIDAGMESLDDHGPIAFGEFGVETPSSRREARSSQRPNPRARVRPQLLDIERADEFALANAIDQMPVIASLDAPTEEMLRRLLDDESPDVRRETEAALNGSPYRRALARVRLARRIRARAAAPSTTPRSRNTRP